MLQERLEENKGEYQRKEAARQQEAQRVRSERYAASQRVLLMNSKLSLQNMCVCLGRWGML